MSVKFEKETVRDTATVRPGDGGPQQQRSGGMSGGGGMNNNGMGTSFRGGQLDGNYRTEDMRGGVGPGEYKSGDGNIRSNDVPVDHKHRGGKHEFVHELGERLTGGEGTVGYLALYLKQLQQNPLRTKMLTSGSLAALQELLASWIAHDRSEHGHYLNARIPKMAAYGAFISAPLGHVLITIVQKMFAGTTSLKAKILQILVSNLIIAPIQNVIYLASMAIIQGARTFHQVRSTVRAGFMPVMKVSWITSPIALAFAQKFLPEQTWVPFFNVVAFVIGTYINAQTKKKRLNALWRKRNRDRDGRDGRSTSGRTDDYYRRD